MASNNDNTPQRREKKTEGPSDMWQSLKDRFNTAGDAIKKRQDDRYTTWDKAVGNLPPKKK